MGDKPSFVVLRLSSLGDVVLASGIPGALKKALPDCRVHFVTKPAFAPAAAMMPNLDGVIPHDSSLWSLAKRLTGLRPSGVLDLQGSGPSFLLRALCPGLSFTSLKNGSFRRRQAVRSHGLLKGLPSRRSVYEEALGRFLKASSPSTFKPELRPDPESFEAADEILARLKGPVPLLALVPGSLWTTKQWPLESFRSLAGKLAQESRILVLGSEAEGWLTAQVAQGGGAGVLDLGGRTGIPLAAALLARCRGAITNDSGLMHLSEAVGTPVLGLFGSTVPELGFAPWRPQSRTLGMDLDCRPCHVHGRKACPLGHFRCMKDLTVERVLGECEIFLRRGEGA